MLDTISVNDRFSPYLWSIEPPATGALANTPTGFHFINDSPYHLPVNGDQYPRIAQGAGPVPANAFRWLPYIAGQVTFCRAAGNAILTGPMSGCWLTVFSIGGVQYFGHIGTHDTNIAHTNAAKNNWKIAVGSGAVTPVKAFNPNAAVVGQIKYAGLKSNGTFIALGLNDAVAAQFTVAQIANPAGSLDVPQGY